MRSVTIEIPDNVPAELIEEEIKSLRQRLDYRAKHQSEIEDDERDSDEKVFNEAVREVMRQPEIRQRLSQIDQILQDKGL